MSQEELERKAIEELKQEKKVEVTYCAKRDLILTELGRSRPSSIGG